MIWAGLISFNLNGNAEDLFGQPHLFATGFTFPEGPVLDTSGNVYLVNYRATVIHKVTPEGVVSEVIDIGAYNNGAIFDPAGNLIIASSGLGAILKLDTEGRLIVHSAVSGGDSLLGPNDMAWDDFGRLYFTDPKGSSMAKRIGGVHFIEPGGAAVRFAGGLAYPNGIAFDLDKSHVYISETMASRILCYEVNPDGSAGTMEVFFELPENSVPDGMKLDVEGNLWVAVHTLGELWQISPDSEILHKIKLPSKLVTNLTFGGDDMKTMYITCPEDWETDNGKIYTLRVPVAGVRVVPTK
jgi:gluconolactonase